MMQWILVSMAVIFAFARGRSVIIWSFLTYTFGFWALAPVMFLPPKRNRVDERLNWIKNLIEENKPEGYKDFNTVDDLMKQLETK